MSHIHKTIRIIYFLFIFLPSLACSDSQQKTIIYVYNGPGASETSLKHTFFTLNKLIDPSYHLIKSISPDQIKNTNWEKDAVLLIMPGGADIPYLKNLTSVGNSKIRSFVENGGHYLGICAGSYYAGSSLEFAKDTKMQVIGKRELGFFPGIVRGPVLADYDYQSNSGCRTAHLEWQESGPFSKGTMFYVLYNGGGYFVDAEQKPDTVILASYQTSTGLKPAIIDVKVGLGNVILSGPHWEYDPELLNAEDQYLKDIIYHLQKTYDQRINLARHLFSRLGVKVK